MRSGSDFHQEVSQSNLIRTGYCHDGNHAFRFRSSVSLCRSCNDQFRAFHRSFPPVRFHQNHRLLHIAHIQVDVLGLSGIEILFSGKRLANEVFFLGHLEAGTVSQCEIDEILVILHLGENRSAFRGGNTGRQPCFTVRRDLPYIAFGIDSDTRSN